MSDRDAERRTAVAVRAATAGAGVAENAFRAGIEADTKADKTDVVTEADHDSQRRVLDVLRSAYPDEPVVGEEDVADATKTIPESGPAWIVDPIDGTKNFVRDVPVWGTVVAAVIDREPVGAATILPALGDVYVAGPGGVWHNGSPASVSGRTDPETFVVAPTMSWSRNRGDEFGAICRGAVSRFDDVRRVGSAQATLSMVATGQLDAAVTNVVAEPWDSVAGAFMVEQAGGTVTDVDGDPWRAGAPGPVVSNGAAHDDVLAAVAEAETGVDGG